MSVPLRVKAAMRNRGKSSCATISLVGEVVQVDWRLELVECKSEETTEIEKEAFATGQPALTVPSIQEHL